MRDCVAGVEDFGWPTAPGLDSNEGFLRVCCSGVKGLGFRGLRGLWVSGFGGLGFRVSGFIVWFSVSGFWELGVEGKAGPLSRPQPFPLPCGLGFRV